MKENKRKSNTIKEMEGSQQKSKKIEEVISN